MNRTQPYRLLACLLTVLLLTMTMVSVLAVEDVPQFNTDRIKRIAGGYWPAPPGFGGNLSGAQVGDPGYYIYESMFLIIAGTDKIIPRLAESWEHEDAITTIHFVKNRTWNDGTPFTARDIYTYLIININDTAINRHLERIEVVDDHTLRFHWAKPIISDTQKMLYLTEGWQGSTPVHIFGQFADKIEAIMAEADEYTGSREKRTPFGLRFNAEQKAELKQIFNDFKGLSLDHPIGTGPYMVDKVTNVECILKVNPYFPDGDQLAFQTLKMLNVSDYNSLLSTNGTDSFIGTLSYDMSRNILDASGSMVMYPLLEQKCIGIIFNTRNEALRDPMVRKALNELVHRKSVRQIANYWAVENDVATTGLIPSTLERYVSPEVLERLDRYTGNPEKAAQMMEAAGWHRNSRGQWEDPEGKAHNLVIAANAGWGAQGITAATEIAQQFSAFGLATEAKAVEATVVVSNMKEGLYDMMVDYLDMTWNITEPYRTFSAYYGDITEKAGIRINEEPLLLKDYEGRELNVREVVDSLLFMDPGTDEYTDLVGRLTWATNDNAIAINLYQNCMCVWENTASSRGLPMEEEFLEYDRMMPLARSPEEYESIAVLNRAYAPHAEVFIRNQVRPK